MHNPAVEGMAKLLRSLVPCAFGSGRPLSPRWASQKLTEGFS